jgi:hypothetical protein
MLFSPLQGGVSGGHCSRDVANFARRLIQRAAAYGAWM